MNEKDYSANNAYKFSLYQQNVLLCEKEFDTNQFSPLTRYSVNIVGIMKQAINELQKCLSKKSYETTRGSNESPYYEMLGATPYDLYQHHKTLLSTYSQKNQDIMAYNPEPTSEQFNEKIIKGVECEIKFYINDKPIVKRTFRVNNFNPIARWSYDVKETVVNIADVIFQEIKKSDLKGMWQNYDLINKRGLTINQINELSPQKRNEMLRSIGSN